MRRGIGYTNSEGYTDRTAFAAINKIIREKTESEDRKMNRWSGVGEIAKDPKYDTGKNGDQNMRIVLIIPRKKDSMVDYISVRLGSRLAAVYANKIHKGYTVAVSGRLQTWTYTPEDGIKRFGYEILADDVTIIKDESSSIKP